MQVSQQKVDKYEEKHKGIIPRLRTRYNMFQYAGQRDAWSTKMLPVVPEQYEQEIDPTGGTVGNEFQHQRDKVSKPDMDRMSSLAKRKLYMSRKVSKVENKVKKQIQRPNKKGGTSSTHRTRVVDANEFGNVILKA
jgi:hypothetical protein